MKEKEKKNLLWAQTVPDVLFGPFSSLLPSLPFKKINKIYIYYLALIKYEREKKELTMGPNDARCVVWAVFIVITFPAL